MNFTTDYRIEHYVLQTKWDELPPAVQKRAIVCSIDLMMALIVGTHGEQFQNGVRLSKAMQPGELRIPGSTEGFSFLGAATAMGHASNSFDIDDGHNMIKGHPGTSFIGGVLAAALEKDITYREYLETLVVSYDVAVRMGLALQDHYQFLHSTGAYGAVATAAGVGRILGFTKEQLNTAISMAEFHAPMVPVMRAVEYPSMNKDGVPFGAMVGALAVLDTLAGETARTHLLELDECRKYTDTLGSTYEIMNLYFKPYTCCRWAHQPILACQTLMKRHGFDYTKVAHVKINTFLSAARLSKIRPHGTDEAQYNIAWPVASALVFGDVGFQQVREEALGNQTVLDMMDRLEFAVDPEMDKEFPAKRLAWVEITLKDGTAYRSDVYEAPGEPEDKELDLNWIEKKFKRITAPMLAPADQEMLLATMTTGMNVPVREVVAKINRSLRKSI